MTFLFPFQSTQRFGEHAIPPSNPRMDSALHQSQAGESQPPVAGLSSVYASFGAKTEKSVSIMVVQVEELAHMEQQYETISKFDRAFAGLQGGNNLPTKPTTIEYVEPITGDAETYIIQTVRAEYRVSSHHPCGGVVTKVGDFIVVNFVDKDGTKRLILPPKVADTIQRQHAALSRKKRTNASKAAMKERMLSGWKPNFQKKGSAKDSAAVSG